MGGSRLRCDFLHRYSPTLLVAVVSCFWRVAQRYPSNSNELGDA